MSDRRPIDAISLPPGGDEDLWAQTANLAELGTLTAALLHEMRQPMFAIKAHAQLGRAEGAAGVERFDRVLDQLHHMEELLRYYGGLAQPKTTVWPEQIFDLNDPVRGAVEMLAHRQRKVDVEVSLDLAAGKLPVRGRELAARQVAVNLLQNAFDAVEGRPGSRIVVRTRDGAESVQLHIEDTGPGIPADMRNRVFEPFVTTKAPGRGTGLGLYIARRLVDEAHGVLRLHEPDAGGARFEVLLPRAA